MSISIHAAREGGDVRRDMPTVSHHRFQSTPPVKAATSELKAALGVMQISIHAAREGGDCGNE